VSNRKTEAAAEHIEDAIVTAVAAVLGLDEQDVEVRVEAPGIAAQRGRWHVALSHDADGAAEPTTDGDGGLARAAEAGSEVSDPPGAPLDPGGDGTAFDAAARDGVAAVRDDDEAAAASEVVGERADGDDTDHAPTAGPDRPTDADVTDVEDDVEDGGSRDGEDPHADLEDEAEAAADFVEGLLDALDLPGDLRITYDDDHAEVEIVDVGSGALIGRRGQTLEAIQELLRCSLQREFQRRARVKVDVEGYRSRRLEKLLEKADEAIDAVLETGNAERLEPMDVFERKAVHHRVAEVEGLISRSQGREPARRVIIERD
jgi:spoIIIJ-associated protein